MSCEQHRIACSHAMKLGGSRRISPSCGSKHATIEADRMKNPDALMVIYYVVLSGVLVFTLGYLAGWRHAKRRQ
jgi:hypothetical protein